MTRSSAFVPGVLVCLLLGVPVAADDPPKKLTPEERKELEAKWTKSMLAEIAAFRAGKHAESQKAAEEALEVARRLYPKTEYPNGHENLAATMSVLAQVLQRRGKVVDAEPLARDALDMLKQLHKGDHLLVAGGTTTLAGVLRARQKPKEAEALYREALDMVKRLYPGDHPLTAFGLSNLGAALQDQRKLSDAEKQFRDALAMRERLYKGDHPAVATGHANVAFVLEAQGKLADAERSARDVVEMRKRIYKGDHPDLATGLNNLAGVLREQGLLADAEGLYREALDMFARLGLADHPHVINITNNLATVRAQRGNYAEAELLHRKVLDRLKELHKGDHPYVARSMNNLASALSHQGKYAEAERLYRAAVGMYEQLYKGDHPDLATGLNNLAGVLSKQSKHADAERTSRAAVDMQTRIYREKGHAQLAVSLASLADTLADSGKFADAEPLARAAVDMQKRFYKGDHPEVATGLTNLAGILADQGKYADAEPLFRAALEMNKRLHPGDHQAVAVSLTNLAGGLWSQGKRADAETLRREAAEMAHRLVTSYARERSEGEALSLLASLPRFRDAFLSVALARRTDPAAVYPVAWADKGMAARVSEGRQHQARAAGNLLVTYPLTRLHEARRQRADLILVPQANDPATRQKREEDLKQLEERIAVLDRAVRPRLPAVERTERLAKATPTDLQKALPGDAAVVDFLRFMHFEHDPAKPGKVGETRTWRYLAFVVTRDRIAWVNLGTAADIEAAVAAWRTALTAGKEIPAAVPAKVRELVWDKVRKELPAGVRTVYVCPDAALCRVPWPALPGDKAGTILLEDYAVATIPHAPFLLDRLWPQDPVRNPPAGTLVVGGVKYDAELSPNAGAATRGNPPVKPGAPGWPFLPATAAEADGVITLAGLKKFDATRLAGEKASTGAVLAALPTVRHAHLATHGFFADPEFRSAFALDAKDYEKARWGERIGSAANSPLVMTGLVFAGANRPKTTGRGIVTGEALVDLDLSGLELAVLSACETGVGDVAGGEGTFGLQRAFHYAGTRNVVASLWKVPDEPTAALMALFYRNLWEKDLPPIEALRQAQLEIYRHPRKIAELAKGFRGEFEVVPGAGGAATPPPAKDGTAHPLLWAAFTLSGPGG